MLNKGTGFSAEERQALGLEGLLPVRTKNQQQQAERIYAHLRTQTDDLQKYVLLSALLNRNMHLFYRVLADNLEELMPIVYTPTVGVGCQRFSEVWRRPRGLFLSYPNRFRLDEIFAETA